METKRPVSLRAVTERINRKLKKEDQKLMKNPQRLVAQYGEYMIINLSLNTLERYQVYIEDLARELGCLADYEVIEPKMVLNLFIEEPNGKIT